MKNNFFNFSIFLIFLPIIFSLIDFISVYSSYDKNSIEAYVNIDFFSSLIYLFYAILFGAISFLSFLFFSSSFNKRLTLNKSLNENSIDNALKFFSLIFFILSLVGFYRIYTFGLLNFFLAAREGLTSIGPIIYFTIIMWPLVLAERFFKRGATFFNIISLVILIFLNLITGFRLILVWGLAVLVIFNWKYFISLSNFKKLTFIIAFLFISFLYQTFRSITSGEDTTFFSFYGLINSLNRTYPLHYLDLIFQSETNLHFFDIIFFWLNPLFIFFNSLGLPLEQTVNLNFYVQEVSTPLFKDYLAFRGTPTYEATGISISIVSFSFLFSNFIGYLLFSISYGLFISLGSIFSSQESYILKILGGILLVGCLFCNESVTVSTQLLVFSFVFIVFFVFFVLFITLLPTFKRKKNRIYTSNI